MTFVSYDKPLRIGVVLSIASLLAGCLAEPGPSMVAAQSTGMTQCPQLRDTERAPDTYQLLGNPLEQTSANLAQGRALYEAERKGGSCVSCHGLQGDGRGPEGASLDPAPRDFTCAATMATLSDGQLFWIIENGSGDYHQPVRQGGQRVARPARREAHTAMSAYGGQLRDVEIWQLVLYLRTLAQSGDAP
jgi:mono/diheme cytochrome c family protein